MGTRTGLNKEVRTGIGATSWTKVHEKEEMKVEIKVGTKVEMKIEYLGSNYQGQLEREIPS